MGINVIFMDINQLILLIKSKIEKSIMIQNILIEDKTYLHKKHKSHQVGKFHIKLSIQSKELKNIGKIEASKKIYKILDFELSLQKK